MSASVSEGENPEPTYDQIIQGLLDDTFKLDTSRFHAGDHVMLARLQAKPELNGLHGEVIKSDKSKNSARVPVRLRDGREVSLKPCNVFSGGVLTYKRDVPVQSPFYENCSVQPEEGKGLGVMAIKPLLKGTVLGDKSLCGSNVNSVMLGPSGRGRLFHSVQYAGDKGVGNVAKYEGGLQALHDDVEKLLVEVGYNCWHDDRTSNGLCTLGGCSYCGPSGLVIAASHGMKMCVFRTRQHRLNVLRHDFTKNRKMVLTYMQPTDMLYVVNTIVWALHSVAPADESERCEFIQYAWDSLEVWLTNAFCNTVHVDDMRALHDPTWPVVKRLHMEHVLAWRKWMQDVEKKNDTSAANVALHSRVKARHDATVDILQQLHVAEAPVMGSNKVFHKYCVVDLFPAAITRVNGAIPNTADRVNVIMKQHMQTPEGSYPDYIRDTCTTLLVTENIPQGKFLAVSYNPGLDKDSASGYFTSETNPNSLSTKCRESAGMRAIVALILGGCRPQMPAWLTAHLEACAQAP